MIEIKDVYRKVMDAYGSGKDDVILTEGEMWVLMAALDELRSKTKELAELKAALKDPVTTIDLPCKVGDTILIDAEVAGVTIGKMPYMVKNVLLDLYGDWGMTKQSKKMSVVDVKFALSQVEEE